MIKSQSWTALLLLLILLLALFCRLYRLVPSEMGVLYAQDADEGVYATTAQLLLQGHLPYRDFFTPMPPVAIYLFAIVLRVVYHPWGSSAGLMALRYASVAYGIMTVLLAFAAGKMIGGKWSGLLAAMIIALDGIVIAQDRRAMLESASNVLSLGAICCYLYAMRLDKTEPGVHRGQQKPLIVGAGFLGCVALLAKGTALVPPLVIALAILARRRWSELSWFVVSLLGSFAICASVFLLRCPQEYIRQTYLFHMLRPWDGTVHPIGRLAEIWNYPWSWTTTRLGVLGIAITSLAGRRVRHVDLWFVVLGWAGLLLVLLLSSRTYWATYFSQLAVPLSIIGGSVLNNDLDHSVPSLWDQLPMASRQLWTWLQIGTLGMLLAFGLSRLSLQYGTTRVALEQTKPAYVEISRYVGQHLPPDVPILAFETNHTFLSSHPPAGSGEGSYFVDSYGEMLYRNMGIADASLSELFALWVQQERVGARTVFHKEAAQSEVRAVFSRAPYTVLDYRALKQLASQTSAYITAHSHVLTSVDGVELRARVSE